MGHSMPAWRESLALYALVLGRDPDDLAACIRKKNPVQLAKKCLEAIFYDALSRVEKAISAFGSFFDAVLKSDRVEIVRQKNSELICGACVRSAVAVNSSG
ncbi:hypothetical protein F9C11_20905 [Amycolatopsis sp. VS8301801F10]|uniref:hypothetical protein n=1 Tax=Amycolatopsis sp. VS8301801F10 TaxID=2652442 RepID=UPI0038FC6D60